MNYFCPDDGGFYSLAFHGFIPEGSVQIADDVYEALIAGQSQGKWLIVGADGYPTLIDRPPPSAEDLATFERDWRDQRLFETDGVLTRHRDEIEDGSETTLTSAQYTELQAYRRALRSWPDAGEFPLLEHRPPAPEWLSIPIQ